MTFPVLATPRLYLRRLRASDMQAYHQRIYADPEVVRTLSTQRPLAWEDFTRRIPTFMVEHWQQHNFGPWVVIHQASGELIGHCGLRYWPDSSDIEVLYALDKRYWGQGLATEGARASLQYGFTHLRLPAIMAAALVENLASRRVLEKIGMHSAGLMTFGALQLAKYTLAAAEYRDDPASYQWLADDPAWNPDV